MPDTRQHRGAHPSDLRLFGETQLPELSAATCELSWLFSRGYAHTSALKLAGDRHRLNTRQRIALSRAACSDWEQKARQAKCLPTQEIQGQEVIVDGFNLLITIEAALSGGVLLLCRDGCLRDLASVHGSYRSVEETDQAIQLIGEVFAAFQPRSVEWLFDKPVSNSGRLAQRFREEAAKFQWPWTADVVFNPDAAIAASREIAVSSDSSVLDKTARWINLAAYVVTTKIPDAWIIDLRHA